MKLFLNMFTSHLIIIPFHLYLYHYHYPQTLLAYSFSVSRNADLSILSGILVKCVQLIFRFMFFLNSSCIVTEIAYSTHLGKISPGVK